MSRLLQWETTVSSLLGSSLRELIAGCSVSLFTDHDVAAQELEALRSVSSLRTLCYPMRFFLRCDFVLTTTELLPSKDLELRPCGVPRPLNSLTLVVGLCPVSVGPTRALHPS